VCAGKAEPAEPPRIYMVSLDPAKSATAAYTRGTFHWHIDGATDCTADKTKPGDPPDLVVRRGDVGAREQIGRHAPHRRAPWAAPAQATITQQIAPHSTMVRCWLSMTSPINAATAGSRLIHTPNKRIGIRRSDSSSSQ